MDPIYLDHNSTTPVREEVLEVMLPYLRHSYGNPSSIHRFGQHAWKAMEEAREKVAHLIHADPAEIVFTGGGTEADNLAIKGVAYGNRQKGGHLITSAIEHEAVLKTCHHLEKEGFQVTTLPVDRYGRVAPEDLRSAIRPDTILMTIMHANNEVGTIQPVEEIGEIARAHGVLFHTDAVQSVGKIPVDVGKIGADLLSMSAHKVNGPKGIGALFVGRTGKLEPQITGGHHEMNRRAGTENVAGIAGLGKAAELAGTELERYRERVRLQRDDLWERIRGRIDYVHLNGHPVKRLPNTLNISFEFLEGESLLINLDLKGVAASTGSACSSGSLDPSRVLLAMGVSRTLAQGSLRFSLGRGTTPEEIDRTLGALTETVCRLRSMSPLYADARRKAKSA